MSETEGRWPIWKLSVVFYPFAAATVAFNLFLAGLITNLMGWGFLTPIESMIWSVPLGVPATWISAKWIRGLMDEADG